VAIIGAGIAGACVVWHARNLGLKVSVFDAKAIGAGASGNAGGIMTPRLDAGAADIAALFADAAYYAQGFYQRLAPEAVIGEGVDLIASKPKDAQRFATLSQQPVYAAGDLRLLEGDPGVPVLHVRPALGLKPPEVLAALLKDVPLQINRIGRIEGQAGAFYLIDDQDHRHGPFERVCLCLGEGVLDWPDIPATLGLRPVRGQMEFAPDKTGAERRLSWGGYFAPTDAGFIFGATHDRDDRGRDVRAADCVTNRDTLAEVLPELADAIDLKALISRASVRVMSRDYLPVCGELQPGLHLLTGLGSRGFCLAPLLGRAVAWAAAGKMSNLRADILRCIRPQRMKPASVS
jgi:tRNA 5-methylaminomethyl-2-thiouridine biosynthesis bifunctional protein